MADTSHDIRRELEITRERLSGTIAALERKVNPKRLLEDYPLVVLSTAFSVGVLTSRASTGGGVGQRKHARTRDVSHTTARTYNSLQDSVSIGVERVLQSMIDATVAAGAAKVMEILETAVQRPGIQRSERDTAVAPAMTSSMRGPSIKHAAIWDSLDDGRPTFASERR